MSRFITLVPGLRFSGRELRFSEDGGYIYKVDFSQQDRIHRISPYLYNDHDHWVSWMRVDHSPAIGKAVDLFRYYAPHLLVGSTTPSAKSVYYYYYLDPDFNLPLPFFYLILPPDSPLRVRDLLQKQSL